MKSKYKNILAAFIFLAAALIFAGCSSSDDSDDDPVAGPPMIKGTAATGAPITGILTVRGIDYTDATADITNDTATTDINEDGEFSINVSALKAPYILRAVGTANGQPVTAYSIATGPRRVNVTSLTDLIVRSVMGNNDLSGVFNDWKNHTADVNDATIDATEKALRRRLWPIMESCELPTSDTNIMSEHFAADHSGMDALLDILDISFDGPKVTITHKLTRSDITMDATGDMTGDNFEPGEKDITIVGPEDLMAAIAISQFWHRITDLYKSSTPDATAAIGTKMSEGFLSGGRDATAELFEWNAGHGPSQGASFLATLGDKISATDPLLPDTYGKGYWITLHYKNGDDEGDMLMAMVYDGSNWFWHGDQRWISVRISSQAEMTVDVNSSSYDYRAYLQFSLEGVDYARSQDVSSAVVTGPGLPSEGIVMEPSDDHNEFKIYNDGDDYPDTLYLLSDDFDINAAAEYTVQLYDATQGGGNSLLDEPYKAKITADPLLPNVDNSADIFPTLTAPDFVVQFSDITNDKNLSIEWTNPVGFTPKRVELWWDGDDMTSDDVTSGAMKTVLDASTDNNPQHGWISIEGKDASTDRRIRAQWYFSVPDSD